MIFVCMVVVVLSVQDEVTFGGGQGTVNYKKKKNKLFFFVTNGDEPVFISVKGLALTSGWSPTLAGVSVWCFLVTRYP